MALDGTPIGRVAPALITMGAEAFLRESLLSQHMPYLTYVDDQVMMLKQGDLLAQPLTANVDILRPRIAGPFLLIRF